MMIEWMSSRPAIALIAKRRKMKLKSAALFTFAKLPLLNPPGAVKKKFCFAIILLTLGKLFPSPLPPPPLTPFPSSPHRTLTDQWSIDRSPWLNYICHCSASIHCYSNIDSHSRTILLRLPFCCSPCLWTSALPPCLTPHKGVMFAHSSAHICRLHPRVAHYLVRGWNDRTK